MNRNQLLQILREHKAALTSEFKVQELYLFGSMAREQATPNSDIGILVNFVGPATSKQYFGVQFYLEDLLHKPIDLVTDKALRPELRPYIEQEAIEIKKIR